MEISVVESFISEDHSNSTLHQAVMLSDFNLVCRLLEGRVFDVDVLNDTLDTPLLLAASLDCSEIVEQLLENGAKVNVQNVEGDTPLHKAASGTNTEIVEMLLAARALVNVKNKQGLSPFHIALSKGYKMIVEPMLDREADVHATTGSGQSPMHIVASHWNCILAETLMDRGESVNVRDLSGRTPLHIAVSRADLTMMELLLDKGANINVVDDNWQTPLHVAAQMCNCRGVKKLLDRGALLNVRDRKGQTALHFAVQNMDLTMIDRLVSRDALTDVRDVHGHTPLHLALQLDYPKLVYKLLTLGVTVDPTFLAFCTPLSPHGPGLLEHLIKMEMAGLGNNSWILGEYFELRDQCAREFELLRMRRIPTNVVLGGIFKNYPNLFGSLSMFRELEKALSSPDMEKEFPLYAFLMRVTVLKARKRHNYLRRAQSFFVILQKINPSHFLPLGVRCKILVSLSDIDLQNLIIVCENYFFDSIT